MPPGMKPILCKMKASGNRHLSRSVPKAGSSPNTGFWGSKLRRIGPYALIFVTALAMRFLHLQALRATPVFSMLMGDAESYDTWAQAIAGGEWIGTEVFYQAPFYPYFLAGLYTLLGRDFFWVRTVQILLGTAACLMVARAGRSFFSSRAGLLAGFLLAVYPPAVFFDNLIQKASLGLFFMSLLLFCAAKISESPKPLRWLAAGAVLGMFALTRENALILAPVMLAYALTGFPSMPFQRRLGWAGMVLGGMLLVLTPVGLRNAAVGGDFTLTTAQFGPNFYIGNHPEASGTYEALRWDRGDWRFERRDAAALAEETAGRSLGAGEVSHYWTRKALAYITAHPLDWLKLMGKKWLLVWNAVETSDTESQYAHARWSPVLKIWGGFWHFGILSTLAVWGICRTREHARRLWLLYLMLLVYAFGVTLFFVFARYRFPLVPLLVLFAAAGLSAGFSDLRPRGFKVPFLCLSAALAAAVMSHWPLTAKADLTANTFYNIAVGLDAEGRPEPAAACYREALALNPRHVMALNNLAVLHARQGDADAAQRLLRRALGIYPGFVRTHNNLGILLAQRGKYGEAKEHFTEVILRRPDFDPTVYFNLACVQSRLQQTAGALQALSEAVARGYRNWKAVATDPDLENLRRTPAFQNWWEQQRGASDAVNSSKG